MTTDLRGDVRSEIRAILMRADSLLEVDRPREALPLLQDALRLNPESLHALASMSRAYLGLDDIATARKFAEAAIRAEPENEWGYRLLSIIHQRNGKKQEAFAAAQTAATLAPDSIAVLTQLFSTLRGLKKKEDMWRVGHRMVELAPNVTASHINLGLAYLDYKRLDEAEAAFRHALRLDPESWVAMNNIGAVLQRKNRTSEAVEFYYGAARLNPALPLPRENLFKAGKRYLAGPATAISVVIVVLATIMAAALDLNDEQAAVIFWSAVALAFVVVLFGRRLRMRRLHEPLQRFLTDEQRRMRRRSLHRILLIALILFGLFFWLPGFIAIFTNGAAGIAFCAGASVIEAVLWAFWWRTRTPKL